jgi:signal peptidase I
MNIFKRISTVVSITVVALAIGMYAMFGWSGSGWKALSVPTGSMRPTMSPGSLVFVHRVPTSSLKIGDIITYIDPLNPRTTLSHRIIAKIKIDKTVPGFVTKGDANAKPDIPIVAGAVVGEVMWHVPRLGNWLMDAKRPIVALPIVYAFGLMTMIEEIKRVAKYYKSQIPYRLEGYISRELPKKSFAKLYVGGALSLIAFMTLGYFEPTAMALVNSNTVSLVNNNISAAKTTTQCGQGNGDNTININNSTSQSSSTGNASSTGGSATSGSSSNSNNTNIGITVGC